MSKLNPSFMEQIEADLKKAEGEAEVFTETQVANFQPQWNKKVTAESMQDHLDFIGHQSAIVSVATANIAHKHYPELGEKKWTGSMVLGDGLSVTSLYEHRQSVDGVNVSYGVGDTLIDFRFNEEISTWLEEFSAIDEARCEALFAEPEKKVA